MSKSILSVIPPSTQNISQEILTESLEPHYDVTTSQRITPTNIRLSGHYLMLTSKFIDRVKWYRLLQEEIPKHDLVISLNNTIPPAVTIATKHDIPVISMIRSLDITGLSYINPNENIISNYWNTTLGGKIQYPVLLNHLRAFKNALKQSCCVVSNSYYIQDQLVRGCGISGEMTDLRVVYPPITLDDYRVEYNQDGKIGMVNPRKHKKGDFVLKQLIERNPEWEFVTCGELSDNVRGTVLSRDNVTYLGWVRDMRNFYEKCRTVIVPSVGNEGFGRVAAEPLVSGIPVVVSDVGGLPEAVPPHSQVVRDPCDVAEWESKIRVAGSDGSMYQRKQYVERFSEKNQTSVFRDIVSETSY